MVGQTDGLVRQVDNHISHAVLLKLTDDLEVVGDGQLPVAAFCTLQELLGQEGFRGDAFTGANEALTCFVRLTANTKWCYGYVFATVTDSPKKHSNQFHLHPTHLSPDVTEHDKTTHEAM